MAILTLERVADIQENYEAVGSTPLSRTTFIISGHKTKAIFDRYNIENQT
jgi:hypothetical protein